MYNEMAEKDKERYQKEMEKYVPMSDAELNKLKQKAEKEKKEKSENSAFKKPYKCSEKIKNIFRRTRDHQPSTVDARDVEIFQGEQSDGSGE